MIISGEEWVSIAQVREILAEEFNSKGMTIATGPMAELTGPTPTVSNTRYIFFYFNK